nr:putative DNA-binding domain-containing protein [uncultured Moraxella sp.]
MKIATLDTFQQQFGQCIRNQAVSINELNFLPKRAEKLYQSLVKNNVSAFVNQCFPICQSLINPDVWQQLIAAFIQSNHLQSPYFIEINAQFVQFLNDICQNQSLHFELPMFFDQLAHYEWVELFVDTLPNGDNLPFLPNLSLNNTVQNLHYAWSVQQIGKDFLPTKPCDTFLLVYRDNYHKVKFSLINAMTYLLIDFIQHLGDNRSDSFCDFDDGCFKDSEALMMSFAKRIDYPDVSILLNFADSLIDDLTNQGVFIKINH